MENEKSMNLRKVSAYLIFLVAIYYLVTGILRFSKDLDQYRLIFGFHTENKIVYLVVRLILVLLFVLIGINTFKQSKKDL